MNSNTHFGPCRRTSLRHLRRVAVHSNPAWVVSFGGVDMATPYADKLRDDRWIKFSAEVKQRDNYTCTICGDRSNLVAHHRYYVDGREPWDYSLRVMQTLCIECHGKVHGFIPVFTIQESDGPICVCCYSIITNAEGYGKTGRDFFCESCSVSRDYAQTCVEIGEFECPTE